jgi:hypothetical protein
MMPPVTRGRRIVIWSLLVAGALCAVLTIFSVWAARQLLNNDRWHDTTTALVADPAVQTALATYLVDQLYENANPAATLQGVLPPKLQPLAGPAAGALRDPLTKAVQRALSSAPVQNLWDQAATLTHKQFINLVEERGHTLLTTPNGGGVVLDLKALLVKVAQQLGLPITGERLPADAAVIKVLSPDQLHSLQTVVKLLRTLAWVLFALTLIVLGVAVWLARGHRRETLVNAALTAVIAAILVLLLRRIVGNQVVGDLGQTATAQSAALSVWTIGTSVLAQVARTVLLIALLLVLAGWLSGPAKWATSLRRLARPALIGSPMMVHGVVLAVLLGILALGIIPAIQTFIAALLLVIVAVAGTELVRRAALADVEADPAATAPPAVPPAGPAAA